MAAVSAALVLPALPTSAWAQSTSTSQTAGQQLSEAELAALVAPIALYPDPLVAQVLMAATYPLEVAEAYNWLKSNASLKGSALDKALQDQAWDASVKSLVSFPSVLDMMGSQLSWTQKLGNAVLAQQKDVMNAIQNLRKKAKAAGHLASTEQQHHGGDSTRQPTGRVRAHLQSHGHLWQLGLSCLSASGVLPARLRGRYCVTFIWGRYGCGRCTLGRLSLG